MSVRRRGCLGNKNKLRGKRTWTELIFCSDRSKRVFVRSDSIEINKQKN